MKIISIKPKIKKELIKIIKDEIRKQGLNADLNYINVSNIIDMSYLFYRNYFNGNIF